MTARNLCLGLLLGWTVAACGGSGGSAATVDNSNSSATDPTPIQVGVNYTKLADFSAYDNWVCDNDTILDPDTGAVLTPEVTIDDNQGALSRSVSGNSIPDPGRTGQLTIICK